MKKTENLTTSSRVKYNYFESVKAIFLVYLCFLMNLVGNMYISTNSIESNRLIYDKYGGENFLTNLQL